MKLVSVTIQLFRNFVDPQTFPIEDDVTCLVGKNESGKTTILQALQRLNPADTNAPTFDVTTEYPRWRLARDRRDNDLSEVLPIEAEFQLADTERKELADLVGVPLPDAIRMSAGRTYGGELQLGLSADIASLIDATNASSALGDDDALDSLKRHTELTDVSSEVTRMAGELRSQGDADRAKAVTRFGTQFAKYVEIIDGELTEEVLDYLEGKLPRFFYFSVYEQLPGQCDLNALSEKVADGEALSPSERTVIALLAHAGERPADFLDEDYDSRKAELQAASADLSRRVFEYWRQNPDLQVVFDTDMVLVRQLPSGGEERHRYLKIELRDDRHGGVETNFSTRSAGFQWFFSFFAAFSEYQESRQNIIVLLDEPGTSLHGEAQKDFIRFVYSELGATKQTMYTTHSQFLVDPGRYEKLRAVHDRATRENPDLGVAVTPVSLSADAETILPVESALGYSVSQHLFLGSGHHLAVEGSSDFVYLQRMGEYVTTQGRTPLDPRLAAIPVGGKANLPVFVALLGRRLKVSALVDGDRADATLKRVQAAAEANNVPTSAIVLCADADAALPRTADIEDLFEVADYLRLYNWAFDKSVTETDLGSSGAPIIKRLEDAFGEYDHALPAHALTDHRDEFFAQVSQTSVERFEKLFELLNQTLTS